MAFLVGDFNQWRQKEVPMKKGHDGYWQANLKLGPGIYRFRYWSDGQWYTDYAAFGIESGPMGNDSIVRVARRHGGPSRPVSLPSADELARSLAAHRPAGAGGDRRGEPMIHADAMPKDTNAF